MEQTIDGPDTFTFTVDVTPGTVRTALNGTSGPPLSPVRTGDRVPLGDRAVERLRQQAGALGLARVQVAREDLGDGTVRCETFGCSSATLARELYARTPTAHFKSGTDASANSTFALYTDECSASAGL